MFSQDQIERFIAQGSPQQLDESVKYKTYKDRNSVMLIEPDIINVRKILKVCLILRMI